MHDISYCFHVHQEEYPVHVLATEESVYFLVLFDDNSVQSIKYTELMNIAPHLRDDCIQILIEELNKL